jgi:hypothetical protein
LSSVSASSTISLDRNWSPRFCDSRSARFSSPPARGRPARRRRCRTPWAGARALLQRIGQAADVHAGALQQRTGAAVVLVQQGDQQVHRFDVLVVVADRQALGIRQRFLELGRQFILPHAEGRLVDADGKLYAYASTTCLVFAIP